MAWVSCDKDGKETIFGYPPERYDDYWISSVVESPITLPTGSIKKLIGRELTWSSEPVELKEDSV